MGDATIAPGHDGTGGNVGKLTMAVMDTLQARVADDGPCDALLPGFAQPQALRAPLRALVQAQQQLLQAEHEVAQVADVLRRDQKYAPAGRPSMLSSDQLAEPPRTGSISARTTRCPVSAAALAAMRPAGPEPTTKTSQKALMRS